jgi:hypothetical protein
LLTGTRPRDNNWHDGAEYGVSNILITIIKMQVAVAVGEKRGLQVTKWPGAGPARPRFSGVREAMSATNANSKNDSGRCIETDGLEGKP